jgi:ribosome-associated protein
LAATRTRGGDGRKDGPNKLKLKTHHVRAGAGPAPKAAGAKPKKARSSQGQRAVTPREPQPAPAGPVKASRTAERHKPSPAEVSLASDEARRVAIAIAGAALEKKAVGLEILDVAGKVDYADFLVLMSGRSDRQVAALADGIQETLSKLGRRPLSIEGMTAARWVLIDFGDVVVHVFQEDARTMYDLEGLWVDAGRLPVPNAEA